MNEDKHMSIFEAPKCLVSTDDNGQFKVDEEILKQIQEIDKQLVILAITGLYRTGKSYLMNRLANSSNGFPLGKTIESKTKGIWIWCKDHPLKDNTVLVLLDTEGLGDVSKGDKDHDNRIFTLAVLLCNVLVYNMMSTFNQDAVDKLTFITEMSKNIRFRNRTESVDDEQLGMILPTFVLCLRDFSLELEKDGNKITPDVYLEDCLKLKQGNDSTTIKYNRPRECIRKYFCKRKCFVFDRPGGRKVLQQLECIPLEDLSDEFIEETNLFLDYMYACESKVLLNSKPVNGRMFSTLIETYVNAIRDGAVPDVDDAFMAVANLENERMAAVAVKEFAEKIKMIELPVLKTKDFENFYQEIQRDVLSKLRHESVFNSEKYEKHAVAEMKSMWEEIKKENRKMVRLHCEQIIQKMYESSIGIKMKRSYYSKPGCYQLYRLDIDKMTTNYKNEVKDCDEYETKEALSGFMEKERVNEKNVLMMDQKMMAEDRKRELERLEKTYIQREKTLRKEFEDALKYEQERNEEHRNQMEMERIEYQRIQNEKLNWIQIKNRRENAEMRNQIQAMFEAKQSMQLRYQSNLDSLQANYQQTIAKQKESLELAQSKSKQLKLMQLQYK